MKPVELSWKITANHKDMLIREFLLEVQGISRRSLSAIKHHGGSIFVNEKPVTVRYPLQEGDYLLVLFPEEQHSEGIKPEELSLDIIHEDEHILVLNKPAGIPTIPSREHPLGTLANGVLFYYQKLGLQRTIHIVNRLDKDTSGLLIVAKHRYAHHLFSIQHKQGRIKRQYECIVHGIVPLNKGVINKPIGRKLDSIIEREVRADGQEAVTHYTVLERFEHATRVSVRLETGRTHQIRVHMSHIGHPLFGDDLYGGKNDLITRQALHSKELSFYHPFEEKEFHFSADLPEDMKRLITSLGI